MRTASQLLLCLAVCGGALPSPAATAHRTIETPRLIGRLVTAALESEHPYARDGRAGAWTRTLSDPGATYLRIHFEFFDLAEGDRLEIADASGSERHIYSGRGPLGTGAFWAFTVPGDTAVLTLRAASGGGEGFAIDAYGRGIEPILGPARDSSSGAAGDRLAKDATISGGTGPTDPREPDPTGLVCGISDLSDPACYRYNHPVQYRNAGGAVLAIQGCCSASTAFKVSDSGQFMSAYRASVSDVELRLGYQGAWCGDTGATWTGAVMGGAILTSDRGLDFTLFTTVGDSSSIPCLQLDRRQPGLGERIYIPQHPWGGPKKMALYSDLDLGGMCVVDPIPFNLAPPTNEIGFLCDTTEGALGAPVISSATERVVGINHVGGCPNTASRMDLIWPRVAALAGSCSNGYACQPLNNARCNCDGVCSFTEGKYVARGGICADCFEEPQP